MKIMDSPLVTVSIANLITYACVGDLSDAAPPIAIRHPTDPSKPWQALSAGPKFTEVARDFLTKNYGATEEGFSGDDVRCEIPENRLSEFENFLRKEYARWLPFVIDISPFSELEARLTREYWQGVPPPLNTNEFMQLRSHKLNLVQQPAPLDEGERGGRGSKVRFFCNSLLYSSNRLVMEKLLSSPVFMQLTEDDLKTTQGGRCVGYAGDIKLANNLGVGVDLGT